MFKKGDIVVAKDEFIEPHETKKSTMGIVVDYNPENDCLVLGELNPKNKLLPHTYSMKGEYYKKVNKVKDLERE